MHPIPPSLINLRQPQSKATQTQFVVVALCRVDHRRQTRRTARIAQNPMRPRADTPETVMPLLSSWSGGVSQSVVAHSNNRSIQFYVMMMMEERQTRLLDAKRMYLYRSRRRHCVWHEAPSTTRPFSIQVQILIVAQQ